MLTGYKYFDTIVTYLKNQPGQTTKSVRGKIQEECWTSLSQAQIYNIIKKMIKDGVLVKNEWLLSLSMQRLQQLEQFVQEAYVSYSNDLGIPLWTSHVYTASSLADLDTIWSDISSKLSHICTENIFYYDPHPYHILWRQDQEVFDIKKFTHEWKTITYLIGHDTFLDQYGVWLLNKTWCKAQTSSLWEKSFFASVGDYRYTVELASHISEYFETFFLYTSTIETFNQDLFKKTFSIKWPCKLTLHHDPEQAKELGERIMGGGI